MTGPISWFPIADPESLAPETRALLNTMDSRYGFIPNAYRGFAWRGARMAMWDAHFQALMQPTPGLPRAEREMVAVVVAMQNQSLYCLAAHGAALREALSDPVKGERVTLDYRRAGLNEKQLAMLDFAVKLTLDPVTVAEDDLEDLRAAGFSEEDAWDVVEITAMANFTNRLLSGAGIVPNAEFHSQSR